MAQYWGLYWVVLMGCYLVICWVPGYWLEENWASHWVED